MQGGYSTVATLGVKSRFEEVQYNEAMGFQFDMKLDPK